MIYPESFEQKIGFAAVREMVKARCISTLGAEYCVQMKFSSQYNYVNRLLLSTAEMLAIINGEEALPLGNIHDMTSQLKAIRVPGTFIPATDLLKVRQSLGAIIEISSFFSRRRVDESTPYPVLDDIAQKLSPFPLITATIDRIIDRFGNVKDNASPALAEIRTSLAATSGTINSIMRRVISRATQSGYLEADTTPSMRDGRLVIPVAPMHKRKINGIVHDESASGKTIYIEPAEIVEANNRIRELQMEEKREITRILITVADEMRPHVDDMLLSYTILGEFDFIHAKAKFAHEIGATMPTLHNDTEMEWYHACHPILLLSLQRQGKQIVPLDITLTKENRILVISGPNAGGKSVCLKTVGIVQYMTQCGLLPPLYENSHMGIFSDIFVDIGDDQSIEDDLSTYSSHLRNMKYCLANGKDKTLILIDEFGGGTEPQIGGAIAQAILRQFNENRMWGVVTTHYQNLKHFAEDTPGLINGSMLYDRHLMQPMFRLSIGNPGSSFAIEIARKTGLPAHIIADAEEIVGSDYINLDKYLLDITRDKRYWENKRTAIRQKEKKLEQIIEQYEEDATTLREKRREILSEAKNEAKRILDSSNATIERTIHDIRRAQADKEKTLEARRRLQDEKEQLKSAGSDNDHPLLRKAPKGKKTPQKPASKPEKEIAVGDNVKLDGQGTVGKVLEISGKNATVAFGMLKTQVKISRLQVTTAQPKPASQATSFVSTKTSDSMRERQLNFKQEIDVRGMRVDEAVQAITYFIDDAIQFSSKQVRILHGTGTGALRQYLRNYLDTVNGVKSYRDEHVQFGGAGITIVELE
jgi:DNA mismatch repair protein MutS2